MATGEASAALGRSRVTDHAGRARLHRDAAADDVARPLQAAAVTLGRDVYFASHAPPAGTPAGDRLLRHELAHVEQAAFESPGRIEHVAAPHHALETAAHERAAGWATSLRSAPRGLALRHPVVPTTANRWTEGEILAGGRNPALSGDPAGATGPTGPMTLSAFDDWSQQQPDWFVGLSEALRADLWQMRALLRRGPYIRAGLGDMKVADLRAPLSNPAQLHALDTFARGYVETEETVHLTTTTDDVARGIDRGQRMDWLDTFLGGPAVHQAMPETDFEFYATNAPVWANLQIYVVTFRPLIQTQGTDPLSENVRFRRLVADPAGIVPLFPLLGHIRNLHRFPRGLLMDEIRLWGTAGTLAPPVTLVVQSGHDWLNSFAHTDEVVLPPLAAPTEHRFRLLIYEGPDTLAVATAVVSGLRASYGAVRDVIIVGHGESQYTELAGTGGAHRVGQAAEFTQEPLDVSPGAASGAATRAFFDALLGAMDPATARVVFAGCLVGTTSVPRQVHDPVTGANRPPNAAEIQAAYGDPARVPLAQWLNQRPAATGRGGFPANFVTGARAETGAPGGLVDPGTGRAQISYPFDPAAFQTATDYVIQGRNVDGLIRALLELVVRNPPLALASLTTRLALPARASPDWWFTITDRVAALVKPAVAALDLVRIHEWGAIGSAAFLALWDPRNQLGTLSGLSAADAGALFPTMLAAPLAGDADKRARMHLVVREAWAAIEPARVPDLRAELDGMRVTAAAGPPASRPVTCADVTNLLDRGRVGPMLPTLLPLPTPAPPTRGQLILALLFANDRPARATPPGPGDPRELQFLYPLAAPTRSLPAPIPDLIAGFSSEDRILQALGLGAAAVHAPPVAPPPVGATDYANIRLGGPTQAINRAMLTGGEYTATVTVSAVNVRDRPGMHGTPQHWFYGGDSVHVLGWVHDWAAVEWGLRAGTHGGRLGFVHRSTITAPPP